MRLVGRKVNHEAGIVERKKNKSSARSLFGLLCCTYLFNLGSLTRRGMFHETEANHANLRLVVDCFGGAIHQSREAGPPYWPQPEARRSLFRSHRKNRPRRLEKIKVVANKTQFFIPLCLPNHTSTNQVTTSLKSSIAVSPSPLPAWGFGAAPAHPRDSKRNESAVVSHGSPGRTRARTPSLASLVATGCFLTSCVFEFRTQHRSFLDRSQSRIFREFPSHYEKY